MARRKMTARDAERIEDLMWLADSGECWARAVRRIGMTSQSAIRMLSYCGRKDVYHAFRARGEGKDLER